MTGGRGYLQLGSKINDDRKKGVKCPTQLLRVGLGGASFFHNDAEGGEGGSTIYVHVEGHHKLKTDGHFVIIVSSINNSNFQQHDHQIDKDTKDIGPKRINRTISHPRQVSSNS